MSAHDLRPVPPLAGLIGEIVRHEIRWDYMVSMLAEVDLTAIERLRAREGSGGLKPSYTALVVKAVALTLRELPYANRRLARCWWLPFGGYRYQQFEACDIAVGVEREVPGAECVAFQDVVRAADQLPLQKITVRLRELAAATTENNPQWRAFEALGTRLPNWLSSLLVRMPYLLPGLWVKYRGGAVIVSSPGKYGADAVIGTWASPIGISFGCVRERPIVRGGQVVAAPTFQLMMNFDRRLMAGGPAGRFFSSLARKLESAELGQPMNVAPISQFQPEVATCGT